MIPRSQERYPFKRSTATLSPLASDPSSESEKREVPSSASMSINSLGFAGMFLVKSEEEAQAVTREGIVTVLRCVAMPVSAISRPGSTKTDGYIFWRTPVVNWIVRRGVGVPRITDDSLAEPQNRDDAN